MKQTKPYLTAEELSQLAQEQLVEVIRAQQAQINGFIKEIERLKGNLTLDSKR